MSKRRVLLVAYQCGPGMGSVSQIGWEWYVRLSQRDQVTLVTHIRNKEALERAGALGTDYEIIYIDTEWFAGPLYRWAKRLFPRSEHSVFLISSLDYFVFDRSAYAQLKDRTASQGRALWDIVHRVTPVTLAAPTWLGRLGLPVVVGPLNSGLQDPPGFQDFMRQEHTWLIKVREFGRWFDGLIGSTRLASRILVATRATLAGVPKRFNDKCHFMVENGVVLERFQATPWPEAPLAGQPLKVLFVGRLIPVKALSLLIDAVHRVQKAGQPVMLTVVGDGPMRSAWEAQVLRSGQQNSITFTGALSMEQVAARMSDCHVFCLPSLRESGGAVLLEAMASARPVVAVDFGGPAELVDEKVGVLIPPVSPEQVTQGFTDALMDVALRPHVWAQRGQHGREKVERLYDWDAKVASTDRMYDDLIREFAK